jgi:hypothetical protein
MPATISVGLTRKVGEANYGSRGGSVSVELEIDSTTLYDPAAFRARVQTLYAMARGSLDEELARVDGATHEPSPGPALQGAVAPSGQHGAVPSTQTASAASGASTATSGRLPSTRPLNGRQATQSQIRAIFAISKRQQLDPRDLVRQRFNLGSIDELSVREASQLIDELNSVGAGA